MSALDKTYAGMTGSYWLAIGAVAAVGLASQLRGGGGGSRAQQHGEYAGDDADFESWLVALDEILVPAVGLSFMDLPDRLWRDSYDDGMSPRDAIESQFGVGPEEPDALIQAVYEAAL